MRGWLLAFLFTQAVEVPIYRWSLGCSYPLAFLPSLVTHPLMWFVLWPHLHGSYATRVAIAEALVITVETGIAFAIRRRASAFVVALLANVASVSVGMLSRHWFGVP